MYHIKNFKPRLYQESIFNTATNHNTLIVLPTGLGKTNIFLMIVINRLNLYPNSKIVLLGPTKPLVDQYLEVFKKYSDIPEKEMAVFTGKISSDKRVEQWKQAKVIFSTPQGFENDLLSSKISLDNVSLLGFDEAHRAVGNYSYVWIAKKYSESSRYAKIVAMTASPGSELEKIQEICNNLFIEAIEVRTDRDPDVIPYVKEKKIKWIYIDLPENFLKVKEFLEKSYSSKLDKVAELGFIEKNKIHHLSKKDLLELQKELRTEINSGNKQFEILHTISLLAEAMKVQHAVELIETQDVYSLKKYFESLYEESLRTNIKASKNLFIDPYFKSAYHLTELMYQNNEEHPKLTKLKEIVENIKQKKPKVKILIFTQYRDSVSKIVEELKDITKVQKFIGQANKGEKGLSQKEQKEIIQKFSENEFDVLVSTSVAEEGLDIPAVDYVIFYEPVPSAIRHIQRKGRTGRQEIGEIFILVTRKTRDEAYRWSAYHKENRMYRLLEDLKRNISKIQLNNNIQNKEKTIFEDSHTQRNKTQSFNSYQITKNKRLNNNDTDSLSLNNKDSLNNSNSSNNELEKIYIYADYREQRSNVIKKLLEYSDVELKIETLDVGDYILSQELCLEFKTKEDFLNSLIDGRLFNQAKNMRNNFKKAIFLIQGDEDLFSLRNINENSIRGLIISLILDYNLPIIFSKNPMDSAAYIYLLAKREQIKNPYKSFSLHTKKPRTLKENQEYLISSIPQIGPNLSKPMLLHFKTIRNLANADIDDLLKVEKIGPEKAKKIYDILNKPYEDQEHKEQNESSNKKLFDFTNK